LIGAGTGCIGRERMTQSVISPPSIDALRKPPYSITTGDRVAKLVELAEAVAASTTYSAKPRRSAPLFMRKPHAVIATQSSGRGAANYHPVSSLIYRQPRPAETLDPNKPNRRADTTQSGGFFE